MQVLGWILFSLLNVNFPSGAAEPRRLTWDTPDCKTITEKGTSGVGGRYITQVCTRGLYRGDIKTSLEENLRVVRFVFSDGQSKSYYVDSRVENQEKVQSCRARHLNLYFESAQIRDDPEYPIFRRGVLVWIQRNYSLSAPKQDLRWVGQAPTGETFSYTIQPDAEADSLVLEQIFSETPGCVSKDQ